MMTITMIFSTFAFGLGFALGLVTVWIFLYQSLNWSYLCVTVNVFIQPSEPWSATWKSRACVAGDCLIFRKIQILEIRTHSGTVTVTTNTRITTSLIFVTSKYFWWLISPKACINISLLHCTVKMASKSFAVLYFFRTVNFVQLCKAIR